jgi:serine/threonine protein kinase/WD40 repeat protein
MTEPEREALFGQLAGEYLDRLGRGDGTSTEEFAAAHPAVADLIREGFPLLRVLRPEPADPGTPARLGEFRVRRRVGRGGMGVVYEAVQEPLGRRVAVKILAGPAAADPVAIERFRREARTAAGLHHTNIVPVFAVGEQDGTPYYAMQFIDGRPLGRAADGALVPTPPGGSTNPAGDPPVAPAGPPRETGSADRFRAAARLGVQAAEALAYAHGQGVLHRDVKPSNLLLDNRGVVWVTDFGLAKAADGPDLTGTGDVVGTLRYMAPERFRGACDARSDVYALGATLYEVIAGRPLFDGAVGAELVDRVTAGRLPTLRQLDRHTPRDLDTVVRKAMALAPADRYPTAAALADDLRRFAADRPVAARRHSWPEQLWRLARRRPAVAGLVAALAAVVVALGAVGWAAAYRQRAADRDTKDRLLRSQIHQARAAVRSGGPGQRFDTLATLADAAKLARELGAPADVTGELRDLAAAALALPDARPTRTWDGWAPGTATLAVAPAGDLFARSDWNGNISVRRIDTGAEVRSAPGPGTFAYELKFSPGGAFLTAQYHGRTDLHLWALDGTGTDRTFPINGVADFSPDGTLLAVPNRPPPNPVPPPARSPAKKAAGPVSPLMLPISPVLAMSKEVGISVFDPRTGVERFRLPAGRGNNQCAFHPDGRRVAVLTESPKSVVVIDLARPDNPRVLMAYADAHGIVWDRTGERLAVVGPVISVRDPDNALNFTELPGSGTPVGAALFTPDGLLVGGESGSFRVWDPPAHGIALSLPGPLGRVTGLSARTDLIAFRGGTELGLWEVSRGPVCRPVGRVTQAGDNDVRDLDWGPGDRFVALGTPRAAAVYDARTGREAVWLEQPRPNGCDGVRWLSGSEVLTTGPAGVWRRPLVPRPDGRLTEGNRRAVANDPAFCVGMSADGQRVAVALGNGRMLVHDPDAGRTRELPGSFPLLAHAAVSSDGRWAAGSTGGDGPVTHRAVAWDAAAGTVVKQFAADEVPASGRVAFSPDGRWLVTAAGGEYRFWEVGAWAPGRRLAVPPAAVAGPVAFDRAGTLLAVAWGNSEVRLLGPAGDGARVTLTVPGQTGITSLGFSRAGDRLAVGCASGVAYVWDLARLRDELAAIGLDWD